MPHSNSEREKKKAKLQTNVYKLGKDVQLVLPEHHEGHLFWWIVNCEKLMMQTRWQKMLIGRANYGYAIHRHPHPANLACMFVGMFYSLALGPTK